jgi:hypothetical protein
MLIGGVQFHLRTWAGVAVAHVAVEYDGSCSSAI